MRNTKHITTGAFTIGLTSLIILGDRVSVGTFMSFLALPIIVYGYYYSFKSSVVVYASCVLMSFVLTGYLPTIITMLGYGFVGLSLVYSRNKSFSSLKTYLIMYITSIPIYSVMIFFFGEYFGVSLTASYDFFKGFAPYGTSDVMLKGMVLLATAIMPLMEAFIMKVSSGLVLNALTRSNKFKSNGKKI